jgi:hypothetical protein
VREAARGVTGTGTVGKWEIEVTPTGEFYEIEIAGTDGEYYFDATGRRADNRYEDA